MGLVGDGQRSSAGKLLPSKEQQRRRTSGSQEEDANCKGRHRKGFLPMDGTKKQRIGGVEGKGEKSDVFAAAGGRYLCRCAFLV